MLNTDKFFISLLAGFLFFKDARLTTLDYNILVGLFTMTTFLTWLILDFIIHRIKVLKGRRKYQNKLKKFYSPVVDNNRP